MSSTFTGITTALNALMSQRRALDVTGQNIANQATPGYSRQRAELSAVTGAGGAALYSRIEAPGWGSQVTSVTRIVDGFVDSRQRDAHAGAGTATEQLAALTGVERLANEPSDTGLAKQLSQFWNAWDVVGNHPDDEGARSALISQAGTLTDTLRTGRTSLDAQFSSSRAQLGALTTQVNAVAASVATLNQQIRVGTATGQQVNELSDQRDQLVLQLSELTGATTASHDDGTLDVVVGGRALVHGDKAESLGVTGGFGVDTVGTDPPRLTWADGTLAPIMSGRTAGLIGALRTTYPNAAAGYDAVAASLAQSVNALHQTGTDLDGAPAGAFFTGTDARTIGLAPALQTTSGFRKVAAGATTALDNSVADAIAQLRSSTTGPDAAWRSTIAQLGVQTQTAQRRSDIQDVVSRQADAARDSTSGVSVDEEMTNMLTFQRGYEGAARVLTTVDQMLDTLINRTGLVGR